MLGLKLDGGGGGSYIYLSADNSWFNIIEIMSPRITRTRVRTSEEGTGRGRESRSVDSRFRHDCQCRHSFPLYKVIQDISTHIRRTVE
jgi:hypothetical protein